MILIMTQSTINVLHVTYVCHVYNDHLNSVICCTIIKTILRNAFTESMYSTSLHMYVM